MKREKMTYSSGSDRIQALNMGCLIPKPMLLHLSDVHTSVPEYGILLLSYDIVIYNNTYIFGLCPISGTELWKPGNFLSDESNKSVFCYVNEISFGHTPQWRMGAGCQESQPLIRGLKLSVLPLSNLWEGEKSWRLNQSSMANDLINHYFINHVMRPP